MSGGRFSTRLVRKPALCPERRGLAGATSWCLTRGAFFRPRRRAGLTGLSCGTDVPLRESGPARRNGSPCERPVRDDGKVSPHLAGISGDGSRLWTIVPVPDPSWTPSPPGTRIAQSGDALDNRFDTVVEVIDLNTNEIVATQRFDQYVFGLLSGETALRLTADDLGVPLWLIQSLTIRPAGRQR